MTNIEKSGFPDVVQVAPKTTKVLYENDKIRVVEERFRKGQKVPMHSHPPHFGYAVSRLKFRLTFPDGKTATMNMKTGDVGFSEEINTHSVENFLPGIMLLVEVK